MGMKVKETSGGGDFTPAPAGLHRAVCVNYIDLGEQEQEFNGEKSRKQQVVVTWEIPDETIEIEGETKPQVVCKFYTKSLHEKATLRHDLEGWRSREFTPDELAGFDLDNILGKPCQVNIIPYTKKNGQKSTKVASVMPLSKGMEKPEPSIEPWRYSIEEDGYNFPTQLSDGFKKIIEKSSEMKVVNDLPGNPYGDQPPEDNVSVEDIDPIPF